MPRGLRQKDKDQPHHIITKAIDELNLFRCNQDKDDYLALMRYSASLHKVEIISYILMDNHVHILVHPRGGDISEFMRILNNMHSKAYNKKYGRSGHLFKGRFKNIIIKDLKHLLRTSTYIHNNAKDLLYKGYSSIQAYPYSSIREFIRPNSGCGIANPNYVLRKLDKNLEVAYAHYLTLMNIQIKEHDKFAEEIKQRLGRKKWTNEMETFSRSLNHDHVLAVIKQELKLDNDLPLVAKYSRKYRMIRAIAVISLKIFSSLSYAKISEVIGDYSCSTIAKIGQEGLKIFEEKPDLFTAIQLAMTS